MDIYGQIAQSIRDIAGVPSASATIFPAQVKSSNGSTCTIIIGSLELSDVRLRAVINDNDNHLICTPANGSYVLVADMSGGQYREMVVIAYSELSTIEIKIGETSLKMGNGKIIFKIILNLSY